MTHHLASLRLRSIGERSARFTDLTLDLTSPAGVNRVPDDSVVWLRNGGGKSSLLSLFYALLLPHANDFMGRTVKRHLTDYVDTGDTSHTVAVWHPASQTNLLGDPEHVLVTGAVYEWVDQRRPVDAEKARERLNTYYYAFYTVPGVLEESTIPFEDDNGQPLRLGPFLAALKDVAADHPHGLDLVVTNKQYVWVNELTNRGLDPEIFRTQKEMNHVEGGVEDLFKFSSAREFINFLLDLTVAPDAATNVADRLSEIANLLASKPAKIEERDFCSTSAGVLDRLAHAYNEMVAATNDLAEATKHGSDLSASFAATIAAAEVDLDALGERRASAEAGRTQASNDAAVANLQAYLYQVRAAELRLTDAQEAFRVAEQESADVNHLVEAWKLADHLGGRSDLQSELEQVQVEAAAEREELGPQRLEHDRHATRLATRLDALTAEAQNRAARERETATLFRVEADQHLREAKGARAERTAALQVAAAATANLGELATEVRRAVQAGHLPSEGTEPSRHHEHLLKVYADQLSELENVRNRRKARPAQRQTLTKTLTDLVTQQFQLDTERSALAADQDALRGRADKLARSGRVRDLTEATDDAPVDLWGEADTLHGRLTREIMNADEGLIRLEANRIDDKRVSDVHARTGFLPTSLDAERVIDVLTEAGIEAQSGWAHLLTLLPDHALAVGLNDPDMARLGCGVVVPTDRRDEAVRALTALDTLTTSLVGVYTAATASDLTRTSIGADQPNQSPTGPAWTGLNQGMVDQAVADSAVNALSHRDQTYTARQLALREQRETDRNLIEQLKGLLDDCPAGYLDTLASKLDSVDRLLEDVARKLGQAQQGLTVLDEDDAVDSHTENQLTERIAQGQTALSRVASLAEKFNDAADWKREQAEADATARKAEATDADETAKAQEETTVAQCHIDAATEADRDLNGFRHETATITFLDGRTDPDPDDTTITLDGLRGRFRNVERAWATKASQSVLADRENRLQQQLAAVAGIITRAQPATLAHAGELLVSPFGQSRDSRAEALAAAERDKTSTTKAEGRAHAAVETAEIDLTATRARRTDPPQRQLPSEPATANEADALAVEQEQAGTVARAAVTGAEAELSAITTEQTRLESRISTFGFLCEGLPDPDGTTATAFAGDDNAAKTRKRDAIDRLSTAEARWTRVSTVISQAMLDLRTTAANYPNVKTQARDRAVHDSEETLAPNAAALAAQLRLRQDMITGELDAITKDQDIVAQSLANLVKDTLDTLRKAERYSRLPKTLGAWADKYLLKIKFEPPANDNDLRTHVNLVIDERVAAGVKAEGLPLLKEAVHKAVGPRGFTVTVLKPTQDLKTVREDITRLGKWSGGEKLTVCVALYCTIAALRAANNGRRDRSGGVLLLDNPIGRASHGSLVWLQRHVAKANAVQLVFTTGVKDPDAVSQFPNIIRLDNRAGRTHNRRYIIQSEPSTSGNDDAPMTNLVTGTRISHTEQVAISEPSTDSEHS